MSGKKLKLPEGGLFGLSTQVPEKNKNIDDVKEQVQEVKQKSEITVEKKAEKKTQDTKTTSNQELQPIIEVVEETEQSLSDIVKEYVKKIEDNIKEENKSIMSLKTVCKKQFRERQPPVTLTVRPEIIEIFDILHKKTNMTKYKICELIIMNGLKSTKFEE